MTWKRIGLSVTGAATVLTVLVACSTLWLLLTRPVTVAGALQHGSLTPIVRELAAAIAETLRALLAYL